MPKNSQQQKGRVCGLIEDLLPINATAYEVGPSMQSVPKVRSTFGIGVIRDYCGIAGCAYEVDGEGVKNERSFISPCII
jgi:hypothetical protein